MVLFTSHCLMSCNSVPPDIDDDLHNRPFHESHGSEGSPKGSSIIRVSKDYGEE